MLCNSLINFWNFVKLYANFKEQISKATVVPKHTKSGEDVLKSSPIKIGNSKKSNEHLLMQQSNKFLEHLLCAFRNISVISGVDSVKTYPKRRTSMPTTFSLHFHTLCTNLSLNMPILITILSFLLVLTVFKAYFEMKICATQETVLYRVKDGIGHPENNL